jgi:hypothetical protein
MLIHNAAITGSLTYNGIDISDITGSEASVASLNSFSSSILSYTASNNTNINALQTFSSSILTYTASNDSINTTQNNRLSSLETTSGSLINASSSFSTRVSSLESFSSSLDSTFATDAELTSLSSSVAGRLTTDESTITNNSSSFASRLTTDETNISNLQTASGSFSTRVTSNESNITSLNSKTGSYATTESNTFVNTQYISAANNSFSFTSTASLYTDGGVRVSKDLYVSGTSYFNNVTIYGTQSVQYITSSQLNIGTNIITVNTDTPSVRFGGLAVYDSGSTGLTGSMLWDSETNHWIYSNPSGSTYSGGMFISGPRTATLGSEQGTTNCMLLAGQGGDHLTSSMIYHSSTTTCIPNTLAGGVACFSGAVCAQGAQFSGKTNVVKDIADYTFTITNPNTDGYGMYIQAGNTNNAIDVYNAAGTTQIFNLTGTGLACFASTVIAGGNILIDNSTASKKGYTYRSPSSNWGPQTSGIYFNPIDGANATPTVTVNLWNGTFGTAGYGGFTDVLTINGAGGAATFSNSVTAGAFIKSSVTSGGSVITAESTATNGEGQFVVLGKNSSGTIRSGAFKYDNADILRIGTSSAIDFRFETNDTERMRINAAGIACFACQVCAPIIHASNNIQIGYGGVPAGTGKLFISRGDQFGLNINAQSGYVRIQGDDDLLAINRGGVDILSMSTCNHLGIRTTASPWAALRVCQCTSNADYAVRVQAVFGINDYLDSDANRIFGGGLSETQFLNGSSSRPAMISLGGNLATSEALGVINFFRSDNASTYRSRAQIWAATNGSGCSTTLGGYITLTTADTGQTNPTQKLTIFSNGVACFACQVCAPVAIFTGCVGIGQTSPAFGLEVYSSKQTAITSDNTFGANFNVIFNRNNTDGTRNCFNILADQNAAYLRTLDNFPMVFVTAGSDRARIAANGIACFACTVCAPRITLNNCSTAAVLSIGNSDSTNDAGVRGLSIITDRLRFGVSPITSTYGAIATNGTNSGITFVTYDNSWSERVRIECTGVTTFTCQVCTPQLRAGSSGITTAGNLNWNTGDGNNWFIRGQANGPAIRMKYDGGSTNRSAGLGWIDNNSTYYETLCWQDQNMFAFGILCSNSTICAPSFSTPGFLRAHNSMKTFHIQKNLDERLSNSDYFRIASTSGGGFQVIVHSFSQNVGVGWSQSQIFHAVNAPYWGGWVGTSTAISTIGDGSGIISSAVIGQDGTITFRVSTGNNGTNTQGTINSFIQVNAFNIDGITLTAL